MIVSANAVLYWPRRFQNESLEKCFGRAYTIIPPHARPNSAIDMPRNAKFENSMTENTRISISSKSKALKEIKKVPIRSCARFDCCFGS